MVEYLVRKSRFCHFPSYKFHRNSAPTRNLADPKTENSLFFNFLQIFAKRIRIPYKSKNGLFQKTSKFVIFGPPIFRNLYICFSKLGPFWIFVKMHFPTKSTPNFSKSAFFDKKISLIFVRNFQKSDQSWKKSLKIWEKLKICDFLRFKGQELHILIGRGSIFDTFWHFLGIQVLLKVAILNKVPSRNRLKNRPLLVNLWLPGFDFHYESLGVTVNFDPVFNKIWTF